MWIQPISQVQQRDMDWLWPGRLALGKLALLEGDPDLGKSYIALDLCARLSKNRPMPDGSAGPGPANSMYLFAEDGASDTIRPRLARLDADLDRIFVPDEPDLEQPWVLPRDLKRLIEMVQHCRPRLVVLDPIMAFLDSGVNSFHDQSLRRLLGPLKVLAENNHCLILLLRHLNKAVGQRALYRGAASIAFSAACRSQWLVARMPDGDGRCVFAQQKNNLAPPQASLAYKLCVDGGGHPQLVWHGETDWTAASVLQQRRPQRNARREEAAEFLRQLLSDGPKTSRQIWAAARAHGFKEITLRRAARQLEMDYRTVYADDDRLNYWLLPGQAPPPADDATDLEPWLGPLRERYPAASPLDAD